MKYGLCIIVILILMLVLSTYQTNIREYLTTTREFSEIDKRSYKVVSGFSDKQQAANKMSELHAFIIDVLSNLKKKFIINQEGTPKEMGFVKRVLDRYNPDVLFENDPKSGEETSYVVNKGDKFAICLRSKNIGSMGDFHDKNILQFVALHELSHLGSTTYGHNPEFWDWFEFMIIQAKLAGLHEPVDYSKNNVIYCGLPVRRNPYFNRMY
jgi:hypothetical protein